MPTDEVVPVAAVVLSYNSQATLAEVLRRIRAQTVRAARVLVVDNGSVDGTAEMLMGAPDVEALLLGENRGVGAGHNAGWRAVMEDRDVRFVWALEHDAFPAPDCLARLLATFDEAEPGARIGAVIPAQVLRDGDLPGGPAGWDGPDAPVSTRMLHLNGTLIPIEVLEAVGLCSEELFCGHEDRELALRIARGGWSTRLDPRAVVVHANFRDAQGTRSTVFRRYYGWRNDLWLRIHVRNEPWARVRAVGAASAFAARSAVRERRPWPQAQARVLATVDALTGRLGRREYRFLTDPAVAEQPIPPRRRRSARRPGSPPRGTGHGAGHSGRMLRDAWSAECASARAARAAGDEPGEWHHLERAHILSQPMAGPHLQTHRLMCGAAWRRRDGHEVLGQVFRLLVAAPGSWTGRYPVGNTGGADVSAFRPMPIPDDLERILTRSGDGPGSR